MWKWACLLEFFDCFTSQLKLPAGILANAILGGWLDEESMIGYQNALERALLTLGLLVFVWTWRWSRGRLGFWATRKPALNSP